MAAGTRAGSSQHRQWINPSQVMNMRKVKKKRKSDEDLLALKENCCQSQGEVGSEAKRVFVGRVTKRVDSSPLVKVQHLSIYSYVCDIPFVNRDRTSQK